MTRRRIELTSKNELDFNEDGLWSEDGPDVRPQHQRQSPAKLEGSFERRLQAARAALGGRAAEQTFAPPTEAQKAARFSDLPTGNADAFLRCDLAANLLGCELSDVSRLLASVDKRVDNDGKLEYRSDQLMQVAAPRIRAREVKRSLKGV